MKKNVASQVIGVQMITAADGTAFTGSVTAVITVDGGTQSASGGTGPTHEGNGFHTYLPTQAETNGDHIGFTFTGTGAIPATVQVYTNFPQTVDNDTLAAGANGFAAIKADTAAILIDTDVIDDGTSGLVKIATDVAAILVDTATTIPATITTAQADLDTITGTDGVTLATAQALYAPAKAGDNMGTVSSVTGNVDGSVGSVVAEVNSNVNKINDVVITGDGSGTPFNV